MQKFDSILASAGIERSKGYDFYFKNYIFNNIELNNKSILDVGGGNGIASFFAVHNNPTCKSLVVDPLEDGSNLKMQKQYSNLLKKYPNRVNFFNGYTDELSNNEKYDIILMHNSINHIGEDLLEKMDTNKIAKTEYALRLKAILKKSKPGAILIVSDCANRNFWGDLNLKNIFSPTIEWHLHKQPHEWQSLLESIGCKHINTNWTARREFGYFGKYCLSTKLVSYFFHSHFCSFYKY